MTYRTKVFTLSIGLVVISNGTKELGLEIVVSEHTYSAVRPLFRWKSAGEITLRGRSEPVR